MSTTSQNRQYEWDLEVLLDNKSIADNFNHWQQLQKAVLDAYENNQCYQDKNKLISYLKAKETLKLFENKFFNYLNNKQSENVADQEIAKWQQKAMAHNTQFQLHFSGETAYVIAHEKTIQSFLTSDPFLQKYQRKFTLIFNSKAHTLDDASEKLVNKLSNALQMSQQVFSLLNNSEIKLLPAKNKRGKEIFFKTPSDIYYILENSNDRTLRKNAWLSYNLSYQKFENTLATLLYHNFLSLNQLAKIYNHKNYVEAVCFDDELPADFIPFVYEQVATFKDAYKAFRKIDNQYRKKVLRLPILQPWDWHYNIYQTKTKPIEIAEAQKIVLDAFAFLGPEYETVIKKAFQERWISWLPKPNKRSGAYSIGGSKGLDKIYILMNYDKTFRSVSTIAHELGHSINSYYTNQAQDLYYGTKIFYAEIASITNEILLNYHLLQKHKKDWHFQLKIYYEMIKNFFACTTRQIMFSNTEYHIIECLDQNIPVNAQSIKEFYAQTFGTYMGYSKKAVNRMIKEDVENGNLSIILRVPHFYTGIFYVYKYSIGLIAGVLIAQKLFEKDYYATTAYFDYLQSGTSLNPLETIRLLGIDMQSPQTWAKALMIVEQWIYAFESLVKKHTRNRTK